MSRFATGGCPECARSNGPHFTGPCEHGLKSEGGNVYAISKLAKARDTKRQDDDATIAAALAIMERRLTAKRGGFAFKDPATVKGYLKLKIAEEPREHFLGLFLDNQHRLISCDTLSVGTIDSASVYPREVLKAALAHNAAAVCFAHNHPSGIAEPSTADRVLTERLKAALAIVDIRVLDHFVVGSTVVSFAERGWI